MTRSNHIAVALPEATIVALARHARPGESLAEVVARLISAQNAVGVSTPIPAKRNRDRYKISVLGHDRTCATLADVLSYTLTTLEELDDTFLHQLSKGGGRIRPYVTPGFDDVHPGRPDLNQQYARELWPGAGWWISTNSSKADVKRILSAACDVAGLEFGRDVVFSNR